ncbi:MAG: PaREP1 family protein [Thermoproteota archaeon]
MVTSKRTELIRHLLSEADGYLARGDAIQSSEKLYKAAEKGGRWTLKGECP